VQTSECEFELINNSSIRDEDIKYLFILICIYNMQSFAKKEFFSKNNIKGRTKLYKTFRTNEVSSLLFFDSYRVPASIKIKNLTLYTFFSEVDKIFCNTYLKDFIKKNELSFLLKKLMQYSWYDIMGPLKIFYVATGLLNTFDNSNISINLLNFKGNGKI